MGRRLTELGLGARAALASPTTALRTALTALGVALGVCVLLIAASVPHAVEARQAREARATPVFYGYGYMRLLSRSTDFRGTRIEENLVQSMTDGRGQSLPPGITRLPGPGEMIVSPAVASLLRGPGGGELRRRLGARVVGTIPEGGLVEPGEALLYRGSEGLVDFGAPIVTKYGRAPQSGEVLPFITLLTIVLVVALLLPVALFVATAAQFGSEERDRRLAAMRLIGADLPAVARMAAGEALLGALAGLALGGLGYLGARSLIAGSGITGASMFSADLWPSIGLAILVAVLVPAAAVVATLISVRAVALEPLGVARDAPRPRRRLLWRLVVPVAGFALLAPLAISESQLSSFGSRVQAVVGVVLALLGAATLLPWLTEKIVAHAPDGPVAWLLAIRRLRLEGGTAPRVVGAIALAVAGAVALTVIFDGARASVDTEVTPLEARTVLVELRTPSLRAGRAELRPLAGVARIVADYPVRAGSEYALEVVLSGGPSSLDRFQDGVAAIDPLAQVTPVSSGNRGLHAVNQLSRALEAGGLVVLAMIGASLLIASAESLRERRLELSDLAAVGAGRRTVACSLLWQAAIPVLGGLVLGVGLGLGLGLTLSATVRLRPVYDWAALALIAAAALTVGLGVTGLTLPALRQALRPPGLRTD